LEVFLFFLKAKRERGKEPKIYPNRKEIEKLKKTNLIYY